MLLAQAPRRVACTPWRPGKLVTVTIAILLAFVTIVPLYKGVWPAPRPEFKILVVGDSITHGFEGDYTWRYRLWEWFQFNRVSVEFVGPYTGTCPPNDSEEPQPPSFLSDIPLPPSPGVTGGYAVGVSSGFSRKHFAVWGRQVTQDKDLIADMVRVHRPDYLLVELGFNDLGWSSIGPEGILQNMNAFIENARMEKPDLKFAIANVPQRTYIDRDDLPINTARYNMLLAAAIPTWSTPDSPVHLVRLQENYQCGTSGCPAGHDGLHPNALGEFQIAQAFTQVLHETYNIGKSILPIPSGIPARPCAVPSNLKAAATGSGIAVTWDRVYGSYEYDVRVRMKGAAAWSQTTLYTNRYDTIWTADGQEWEYQIRAGDILKSDWTGVVSAVAHLQTAPGPKDIVVHGNPDGCTVSWSPPDGNYAIDRYEVLTYDKLAPGRLVTRIGVRGTSTPVMGLTMGHHYVIAIATWTDKGGGLPSSSTKIVTAGYGVPSVPTNLKVVTTDTTTVRLTWAGDVSASGYRVWIRNIKDGSLHEGNGQTSNAPCWDVRLLSSGAWNYEFCVSAINGDDESGKSKCITAPEKPTPISETCSAYLGSNEKNFLRELEGEGI